MTLIVGILGGYKIFVEGLILGKKDELDATRYLVELCKEDGNKLLIEKAYKTAFRKTLCANEIMSIINFDNPTRIFSLYHSGKKYLEIVNSDIFYKNTHTSIKRYVLRKGYFSVYMISGFIAIFPALMPQQSGVWSGETVGAALFVFFLSLV